MMSSPAPLGITRNLCTLAATTPPPYGTPGFLCGTVFITEQPEYNFLKEMPRLP